MIKVTACKRQGKKLLEIESQEENNMLSELLYSSSRVTNVMDEVTPKVTQFLNLPKPRYGQVELDQTLPGRMSGFGITTLTR